MVNKRLLRTKNFLDEMFIAKFLYSIDDRLFQWLEQCCRAESVDETNLELTNFASIFSDIQLNKFHCALPPTILQLKRDSPLDSILDNKEEQRKRNKINPERCLNADQNRSWKLRQSETWNNVFKNKTRDGPVLSCGSKPCIKYHVKGVCYSDCPHIGSHRSLSGDDKSKTEAFIKSIRGE